MATFAYVRVSTKDQHLDRQIEALQEYEIPEGNIFADRQSGKNFERPAYRKLMRKLKKGDLLIIKSIDRLGRNYDEILEQWRVITRVKEVDILVIDFPLLDTRKKPGNLTGVFISDLVLQILSYVAQTERDF
ncbi:MAG: recombinase family protein, partial [Anaerovoracaceae bacterium]